MKRRDFMKALGVIGITAPMVKATDIVPVEEEPILKEITGHYDGKVVVWDDPNYVEFEAILYYKGKKMARGMCKMKNPPAREIITGDDYWTASWAPPDLGYISFTTSQFDATLLHASFKDDNERVDLVGLTMDPNTKVEAEVLISEMAISIPSYARAMTTLELKIYGPINIVETV